MAGTVTEKNFLQYCDILKAVPYLGVLKMSD